VKLKEVKEPSHKQLVECQEIKHPEPEVAEIEMVQSWDNESEEPAEVGIEIIRCSRNTRFSLALFFE
jgi:hypothetical protein